MDQICTRNEENSGVTDIPNQNPDSSIPQTNSEDGKKNKEKSLSEEVSISSELGLFPLPLDSHSPIIFRVLSELELRQTKQLSSNNETRAGENLKHHNFHSGVIFSFKTLQKDHSIVQERGKPKEVDAFSSDFVSKANVTDVHAEEKICDLSSTKQEINQIPKEPLSKYDLPSKSISTNGSKGKKYECETCGKCYPWPATLKIHQRIHTGERPFKCETCDKCFARMNMLSRHIRSHTGDKHFQCMTCGKYFAQSSNLTVHMRSHTGERPFQCETCGKCFARSDMLSRHKISHTGIKGFSCEACGKCFTQRSHLTVHKMSHTGERPCACETCGQCFTSGSSRLRHQVCHTGEKHFVCGICGISFKRNVQLTVHIKSHTGQAPD